MLAALLVFAVTGTNAQNPIIQTMYTADPAPMVYNNRLYVYTTHDEDASTWFTMNNWKVYSTNDMVNWTDHGVILSYSDFEWGKGMPGLRSVSKKMGSFTSMYR
ncbi:hypothetical protein LWM68_12260 [Niabella sp. W65]|nr:hypothetical protein [Niabella sp. W65]MCH7363448.1 hypothetical protein [Niabella sp. W65]ULT39371.1 hypothetical protein KRR40_31055 [Niabella sp. I65]